MCGGKCSKEKSKHLAALGNSEQCFVVIPRLERLAMRRKCRLRYLRISAEICLQVQRAFVCKLIIIRSFTRRERWISSLSLTPPLISSKLADLDYRRRFVLDKRVIRGFFYLNWVQKDKKWILILERVRGMDDEISVRNVSSNCRSFTWWLFEKDLCQQLSSKKTKLKFIIIQETNRIKSDFWSRDQTRPRKGSAMNRFLWTTWNAFDGLDLHWLDKSLWRWTIIKLCAKATNSLPTT